MNEINYNSDKRELVIKLLKQYKNQQGRGISTSRIGVILKMNYYALELLLDSLLQEGLIIKSNGGRVKYWRIADAKPK